MAEHRKSDQRRDYLCAVEFCKRVQADYSFSTETSVALIIAKTLSPSLRFMRFTEPVVIIDVRLRWQCGDLLRGSSLQFTGISERGILLKDSSRAENWLPRQRSDRLRFHPRIRRHNDDGRIRKASGGRPRALYGMPEVQRDLKLGRTPTSSRLQAFRIPSLKGLTSRDDSRFSYAEKCDPTRVKSSPFFEIALVLVRLDHLASTSTGHLDL